MYPTYLLRVISLLPTFVAGPIEYNRFAIRSNLPLEFYGRFCFPLRITYTSIYISNGKAELPCSASKMGCWKPLECWAQPPKGSRRLKA